MCVGVGGWVGGWGGGACGGGRVLETSMLKLTEGFSV